MRAVRAGAAALALALLSASASAGADGARPPVAITASPSRVDLVGAGKVSVRVTNSGTERVTLDVRRAGFALDFRVRPKIVAREAMPHSAARWLTLRPRTLVLRPRSSAAVTVTATLPRGAEPGDHDALVLLTTRRRPQDGVSVRMRMGVLVVVRAPGAVVHRLGLKGLRVTSAGRQRILELVVANGGNVTESFRRARAVISLQRGGRQLVRLRADTRDVRPGTRGVLQFRLPRRLSGSAVARVDVVSESGRALRRAYRVRL